ncbi:hypothetical protein BDV98DRAFT_584542 [Pterulicium gracile]|uniref:Uncharacterized protein n=1 Tax=Pterulicium gracile TaxID=1884261 RepID=A0A5C3QFP1_9AGAR|nr:hypothetical protein BDV98DRAFT_584542 [Pterula gracilis]
MIPTQPQRWHEQDYWYLKWETSRVSIDAEASAQILKRSIAPTLAYAASRVFVTSSCRTPPLTYPFSSRMVSVHPTDGRFAVAFRSYYLEPKLAKELKPPLCITLDIDPSFSSYVLLGFYFDRDFARSVPDSSSRIGINLCEWVKRCARMPATTRTRANWTGLALDSYIMGTLLNN